MKLYKKLELKLSFIQSALSRIPFRDLDPIYGISPKENLTITPERDFYVLGEIIGEVPEGTLLIIALFNSDDKRVRQVFTNKKIIKRVCMLITQDFIGMVLEQ